MTLATIVFSVVVVLLIGSIVVAIARKLRKMRDLSWLTNDTTSQRSHTTGKES